MVDLIQEEITASGVDRSQFIFINFENMSNVSLCTAQALHDEIVRRAAQISRKVYLFLMKSRKYGSGKNVLILFILPVLMPSCFPAS